MAEVLKGAVPGTCSLRGILHRSVYIDTTLTQSGQAADAKATGEAILQLSNEISNLPGDSGSGAGWSTEEIALLEIILGKAVYSADQTNNIEALIALLKSTSSGSEGSGGDSGGTTYTITLNLDGVTSSNMSASVSSGSVYVNQLEPIADGYVLGSVTITMGGYDVTNKYYDGEGNITITSVSGDVVIACKALICETLNMVGLGSGKVDYTTFDYTVSQYGQYNLAEESETTGGYLSIAWDTDSIDGAPRITLFLFKDGEPYKIGKASINAIDGAELVEVNCDLTYKLYWIDAGTDYGTPQQSISAPCKVQIPDGCTVMCMFSRGSLNNDEVSSNATFGAWVAAGGLTVAKVEGE